MANIPFPKDINDILFPQATVGITPELSSPLIPTSGAGAVGLGVGEPLKKTKDATRSLVKSIRDALKSGKVTQAQVDKADEAAKAAQQGLGTITTASGREIPKVLSDQEFAAIAKRYGYKTAVDVARARRAAVNPQSLQFEELVMQNKKAIDKMSLNTKISLGLAGLFTGITVYELASFGLWGSAETSDPLRGLPDQVKREFEAGNINEEEARNFLNRAEGLINASQQFSSGVLDIPGIGGLINVTSKGTQLKQQGNILDFEQSKQALESSLTQRQRLEKSDIPRAQGETDEEFRRRQKDIEVRRQVESEERKIDEAQFAEERKRLGIKPGEERMFATRNPRHPFIQDIERREADLVAQQTAPFKAPAQVVSENLTQKGAVQRSAQNVIAAVEAAKKAPLFQQDFSKLTPEEIEARKKKKMMEDEIL